MSQPDSTHDSQSESNDSSQFHRKIRPSKAFSTSELTGTSFCGCSYCLKLMLTKQKTKIVRKKNKKYSWQLLCIIHSVLHIGLRGYEKFVPIKTQSGQLISVWNFGVQNFPKIVRISDQKSKKCLNQTNKDRYLLCQITPN